MLSNGRRHKRHKPDPLCKDALGSVGLVINSGSEKKMLDLFRKSVSVVGFCAAIGIGTTAYADAVSDYYAGKSIRLHIGAAPGGA